MSLLHKLAAPAIALGSLGLVAGSAVPAFASTTTHRPTAHKGAPAKKAPVKKTPAKKAPAKATKRFDLRGSVGSVDAKASDFTLKVGKHDVVVHFAATTHFLLAGKTGTAALLKAGATVTAKGTILDNARMATLVTATS